MKALIVSLNIFRLFSKTTLPVEVQDIPTEPTNRVELRFKGALQEPVRNTLWTKEEDARLLMLMDLGFDDREISVLFEERFGKPRTPKAIQVRRGVLRQRGVKLQVNYNLVSNVQG